MLASSPQALHQSLLRLCDRLNGIPEAGEEIDEVRAIAAMAQRIGEGSRAQAFLAALRDAMERLSAVGAPEKAVVFSENTATLAFLADLLARHGYTGVTPHFCVTRSKRGLADFARGPGRILLITDGAATGLDLSHCALVINYDLPWNMQKLEQRISRCHRYGQKHDVLAINFLDPTNRADRRLYDSLNRKLKRFDDLFSASETLLGELAREGNVPPEFRNADEIRLHDAARTEAMRPEIEQRIDKAEADLLAHFDEEVRRRFAAYGETIPAALSQHAYWLRELTRYRLRDRAKFDEMKRSFVLMKSPYPDLRLRRLTFGMDRALPPGERYHLGHPLARRVLADCLEGPLEPGVLILAAAGPCAAGMAGELGLWLVGVTTSARHVTEPVLCGVMADSAPLSHDACADLLKLEVVACEGGRKWDAGEGERYRGRTWRGASPAEGRPTLRNPDLDALRDARLEAVRQRLALEHDDLFREELDRLLQWAEDEEAALRERQEDLRRRIAEARTRSDRTAGYVGRFQANQQAAALEKERRREEARIVHLTAEVRRKRDERIAAAREKAHCRFWDEEMFVVKFKVVDNSVKSK